MCGEADLERRERGQEVETPWGCLEDELPQSKAAYGWTAEEREGQKGGAGLNGRVRSLGSFFKN